MPRFRPEAAQGEYMFFAIALISSLSFAPRDTIPIVVPSDSLSASTPLSVLIEKPVGIGAPSVAGDTTPSRRRKAVEVSDLYEFRLKIHYLASYATIPIFAAQAIVGQQLYNQELVGPP